MTGTAGPCCKAGLVTQILSQGPLRNVFPEVVVGVRALLSNVFRGLVDLAAWDSLPLAKALVSQRKPTHPFPALKSKAQYQSADRDVGQEMALACAEWIKENCVDIFLDGPCWVQN